MALKSSLGIKDLEIAKLLRVAVLLLNTYGCGCSIIIVYTLLKFL